MAALQREQLNRLCSSRETFEKAQSILRIAHAKTGPGSGFVVKSPVALPAICAYLASEQLNAGEVSLQSAVSAACVAKAEFSDILKKVRAALGSEEKNATTNVTYESLVDAHHIFPREDVIASMEDVESCLQRPDLLKERYGANVMSCAIFYWVCQLVEEPSVQERSLRQAYSLPPKAFKAAVTTVDKQCAIVADEIKSLLFEKRSCAQASTSAQPTHISKPTLSASPPKSPKKSAIRLRTTTDKTLFPVTTPSKKRTAFLHVSPGGDGGKDDGALFPETPTKRRRIDSSSLIKPTASSSPTKRPSAGAVAAFHAALKGSPTKLPAVQENGPPVAGPSTPRHSRRIMASEAPVALAQADSQTSPSRSQGRTSPTRSAVRRRFRPVFLDQQQWCARDPKVEKMWAAVESLRDRMVELHGHPFQGTGNTTRSKIGI